METSIPSSTENIEPFSDKSIKEYLDSLTLKSTELKILWLKWIPLKVNAFAWRAGLDKIPSKENIQKCGIYLDTSCTLCGYTLESTDHTLIRCKFASEVWNKVMN
ncbi:hypothetical protein E3N88_37187 [Mikania micrantha]|uniref:Reverse transcriptase zinc-binding domain-containing protein n=1 Tax=Mikania micrantha TaxID=192012 RepID=A0A5N6M617_9ASTR|nr:hypothetical protein E3N88_37187 [Mikania micrantha]